MESQRSSKIITCILPKSKALPVLEAVHNKGFLRAYITNSRGFSIGDAVGSKGNPVPVEKEIITLIAKDQQEADEIFEFIYFEAKLNEPGGGLMFMGKLNASTPFNMPNL